jgi:hypothetical protein
MALRIALLVLFLGCGLLVAQLFRFTPLQVGEGLGYTPVWDRWFQRVCTISFPGNNQVNCSVERFTNQFSEASQEPSDPMTQIEQARRASFSELEILQYIEQEIKTQRRKVCLMRI